MLKVALVTQVQHTRVVLGSASMACIGHRLSHAQSGQCFQSVKQCGSAQPRHSLGLPLRKLRTPNDTNTTLVRTGSHTPRQILSIPPLLIITTTCRYLPGSSSDLQNIDAFPFLKFEMVLWTTFSQATEDCVSPSTPERSSSHLPSKSKRLSGHVPAKL